MPGPAHCKHFIIKTLLLIKALKLLVASIGIEVPLLENPQDLILQTDQECQDLGATSMLLNSFIDSLIIITYLCYQRTKLDQP